MKMNALECHAVFPQVAVADKLHHEQMFKSTKQKNSLFCKLTKQTNIKQNITDDLVFAKNMFGVAFRDHFCSSKSYSALHLGNTLFVLTSSSSIFNATMKSLLIISALCTISSLETVLIYAYDEKTF